ncbi:hypothetical protein HDU84_007218, partial [Entophlyctis sp. JEL0112]
MNKDDARRLEALREQTRRALAEARATRRAPVIPAAYSPQGTPLLAPDVSSQQNRAQSKTRVSSPPRLGTSFAGRRSGGVTQSAGDPVIDMVLVCKPNPQFAASFQSHLRTTKGKPMQPDPLFAPRATSDTPAARSFSPKNRPAFNTSPRIHSAGEMHSRQTHRNPRRGFTNTDRMSRKSPSPIFQFHNERLQYTISDALNKDDEYFKN